jgi:hypothetical protein
MKWSLYVDVRPFVTNRREMLPAGLQTCAPGGMELVTKDDRWRIVWRACAALA